MNKSAFTKQLCEQGITLAVSDSGNNLVITAAPGSITGELRAALKAHKQALIESCCYRRIVYERERLYGQLPACYQTLPDGRIMALYRNETELQDHITRAVTAKRRFKAAGNLVEAACVLGGVVAPVQGPGDLIPF